ncbi:unnamed protein product [Mytilus coruscus]|uniref:Reverse transcriptase domain-containing protein n=1 Tax=Mytilus coruscus TaxID=42192 RepID=A0A6J8A9J4_MYTCO|nr:unnamed protein product [Mytilus coruscus]
MSSPKFDTFEKKSLTCAYCKKNGHLMADCFRLQKKNDRDNKPKTSACTTPRVTNTLECPASQAFKSSFCDYMEDYKPFMSDGFASIVDNTTPQPIKIIRDTGASQSLLLEGVLPLSEETSVGASVLLQGEELGCIDVPLHRIYLKSDLITGPVLVDVRPNLPVEGVSLLLGNDLARNKVVAEPIVTSEPDVDVKSSEDDAELYPPCGVTTAMARKQQNEDLQDQFDYMDLSDTLLADIEGPGSSEKAMIRPPSINRNVIMPLPDVNSHSLDPEVLQLYKRAQPQEEADKVAECYYHQDGILMRKWRPPDATPEEEWRVVYQVVVPKVYRQEIIGLAHDTPLAGHLVPGHPLQAKYCDPYTIESKIIDFNYNVKTPDRRKQNRVCHINMLKPYFELTNEGESKPVATLAMVQLENNHDKPDIIEPPFSSKTMGNTVRLKNSVILPNLDSKLAHVSFDRREKLKALVFSFKNLFPDVPNKTTAVCHDVDIGDASPIKQHPYRFSPLKLEFMRPGINYMLDNDIIEPSNSEWSSPCLLVPKPDKTFRFVTDSRKVNSVSKSDSYPIPRIDDCIDNIGKAKFVSKFDLLKGYWQVPLTQRAREISAFVTPDGLFQYTVMPFGMKGAPATFQSMINNVIKI